MDSNYQEMIEREQAKAQQKLNMPWGLANYRYGKQALVEREQFMQNETYHLTDYDLRRLDDAKCWELYEMNGSLDTDPLIIKLWHKGFIRQHPVRHAAAITGDYKKYSAACSMHFEWSFTEAGIAWLKQVFSGEYDLNRIYLK